MEIIEDIREINTKIEKLYNLLDEIPIMQRYKREGIPEEIREAIHDLQAEMIAKLQYLILMEEKKHA